VNVERDGPPTDDQIGLVVRQVVLFTGQFATRVHASVEQLRFAVLLAGQFGAEFTHAELSGVRPTQAPYEDHL